MEPSQITLADLDRETRAVLTHIYWRPMRTEHEIARERRLGGRASRVVLHTLRDLDLVETKRGRYLIARAGRALILEERKLAVARDREARASLKQDQGLLADEAIRHAVSVMSELSVSQTRTNCLRRSLTRALQSNYTTLTTRSFTDVGAPGRHM